MAYSFTVFCFCIILIPSPGLWGVLQLRIKHNTIQYNKIIIIITKIIITAIIIKFPVQTSVILMCSKFPVQGDCFKEWVYSHSFSNSNPSIDVSNQTCLKAVATIGNYSKQLLA